MKLKNLKRRNKQRKLKDIKEGNYIMRFIIVLLITVIFAGCAARKNTVNVKMQTGRDEIVNQTLFDLIYVEGLKEKMKGNIGEAVNKFEDALKIYPGSDAANYQVSQISAMRRDFENALKYGRRAAEIDGQNPWYLVNMANIYIQINKLDSAAVWIQEVLDVDPDNMEEKYRLGNIYMQTGNHDKAEGIFEEFYMKYGGNEQILNVLIEIKISLRKYDDAETILLDELKKDDSKNMVKGMLAEVYRQSGKMEKAEELYAELVNNKGYNAALDYSYIEFLIDSRSYEKLFKRANDIIEDEGIDEGNKIGLVLRLMEDSLIIEERKGAIVELGEKLLNSDKEEPRLNMLMSEIYSRVGEKEKEIEVLTDFIEKNNAQYYIWEKLLLTLNETENTELIYKYSSEAAKLFNTAPLPKIMFAYALIEKGEYDKAEKELEKVRILVNNQDQFLVQILSMEAEIAYRQGNSRKAYEKFEEALNIESNNTVILNNYAYYLAEENTRLKDAKDMIEKVIRIEKNITYMDTYAWVLYKMNRIREAEKVMNEIFSSANIDDAEILEHYGYIKAALNECGQAVKLWQAAVRNDKTKEYLIEEIRKCIEK